MKNRGEGGQLLLTRIPAAQRLRFRPQQTLGSFGAGISLAVRANFRPRPTLTFPRFRGRILFGRLQGQIARTISEDRVNRRRMLAGIITVGVLGVCALFLPSFHKTPGSASPSAHPLAQSPSEPANSQAESEPPIIPTPVVEAKAASRPPAPQSVAALPDVDPHKAFGSKNAPVTMEVFSDFQCPACKTLFTTTNRRLMDDYVSNGKVYLIHRDFPLPMHAHS